MALLHPGLPPASRVERKGLTTRLHEDFEQRMKKPGMQRQNNN
jgi:hypothetical protein